MNWLERYFRRRWFKRLLKEGQNVRYFGDKAFIDWQCEWIVFLPDGAHMEFKDWEEMRIRGLSPKEAIQEDLSYA